jgi:hypothetical protein
VLEHGKIIAVYPDDATIETMRTEGWSTVRVGFVHNDAGEVEELELRKADGGTGTTIRYNYRHQRPHIRVTVSSIGSAVPKPDAGACRVRRDGDAFIFSVLSQFSITVPGVADDQEEA